MVDVPRFNGDDLVRPKPDPGSTAAASSSDSTSVEQSTPASDTPDPTDPVDGPATQVEEPATATSTVSDETDYDPNVYASPDSNDLVSRDTAASAPTPDPGDSQTHGRISEAEDDDLSETAADSNLSGADKDAFDKFADLDREDL
jgi:hypothetical protein